MSSPALVSLKPSMAVAEMVEMIRSHIAGGGPTVKRVLDEVNLTFFVRTRLDDARVLVLADIVDSGGHLPPMVITVSSNELVDGRHRKEAHELANRKEGEFVLVPDLDRPTLIALAMALNHGGALPPTKGDIHHTIEMLLGQNVPTKRILELMPFPPSMVRRYVQHVQSRVAHVKLMRAANVVAEGKKSVSDVAKEFGVDEGKLKDHVAGNKKTRKKGLAEMKGLLSQKFGASSRGVAQVFRKAFDQIEDGDLSLKAVREIVAHAESLNRRASRNIAGWRKRLETKASNGS